MTAQQPSDAIFSFLKALADESRLTLLRILYLNECNVGDLAGQLDLTEPTVSHHLARLREVGLVTLRMDGNQRFYRLNPSGLARFKRLADQIEQPVTHPKPQPRDDTWIAALGWDEADAQILREHTAGPRLTHLPNKQKKTLVILRWLAGLFQTGRLYTEAEVNTVLKTVYAEDFVSLRRDLIDYGYMRRERGGGKYWLAPFESEVKGELDGNN
jgi:hypothetical protein